MSQSPLKPIYTDEAAQRYTRGWGTISDFMKQGRSWSGNERHCAYLNMGRGKFANVSAISGLDFAEDGRCLALTDIDGDGDLDMWLANRTGPQLRLMRNDAGEGHFVALRLNGVTCNRDAIGARVTVRAGAHPLVRTMRAGESYKSQSTKWLHFGLGESSRIAEMVVRWPDGKTQTFNDVAADKHYVLTQGVDELKPWRRPGEVKKLAAAPLARPKLTEQARVVFAARMPVPLLSWTDADDQARQLIEYGGKPVLLNIWASWCAPCVDELKSFKAQGEALRQAGLNVIALSVDGLDTEHATDKDDAVALLNRLGFDLEHGFADAAMMDKLSFFHHQLYGLQADLPVPSSLLIDAQGRLAAVYRGPVRVQQVLKDMALLDAPPAVWRDQAAPLPGRWHGGPPEPDLAGFAGVLLEHGYLRDAVRYMALLHRNPPSGASLYLSQTLTDLGSLMVGIDKRDRAAVFYRSAIVANETNVKARTNLAGLLQLEGQLDEAALLLREAVHIDPQDAIAHLRLGTVLLEMRRAPEAIEQLRKALAIDDSLAGAHNELGILEAQSGQLEAAAASFARAADLVPSRFEYRHNHCRALMGLNRPGEALGVLIAAAAEGNVWQVHREAGASVAAMVLAVASNGSSDPKDVARAVQLAQLGVQDLASAALWDALAAAHAAAGQFEKAVDAAEHALKAHDAARLSADQVQAMKARLALYQQGRPYRVASKTQ